MTQRRQIGGCFAPPLDDELLARYRERIDAVPRGRLRDALETLHACCERWWQTASRASRARTTAVVDLDSEQAAALDDLIPWSAASNGTGTPDELEAIQAMLDGIQVEAAQRNSERVTAWRQAVSSRVSAAHLGDADPRTVKAFLAACASADDLLTPEQRHRNDDLASRLDAANDEARQAFAARHHADFAFPDDLEDTSLRDMAFHLLWFVKEFDLGREPLTNDML